MVGNISVSYTHLALWRKKAGRNAVKKGFCAIEMCIRDSRNTTVQVMEQSGSKQLSRDALVGPMAFTPMRNSVKGANVPKKIM